jgi:hypothetical protein
LGIRVYGGPPTTPSRGVVCFVIATCVPRLSRSAVYLSHTPIRFSCHLLLLLLLLLLILLIRHNAARITFVISFSPSHPLRLSLIFYVLHMCIIQHCVCKYAPSSSGSPDLHVLGGGAPTPTKRTRVVGGKSTVDYIIRIEYII